MTPAELREKRATLEKAVAEQSHSKAEEAFAAYSRALHYTAPALIELWEAAAKADNAAQTYGFGECFGVECRAPEMCEAIAGVRAALAALAEVKP